jgi:hypothetical protein
MMHVADTFPIKNLLGMFILGALPPLERLSLAAAIRGRIENLKKQLHTESTAAGLFIVSCALVQH